jgi:hypothetical protein
MDTLTFLMAHCSQSSYIIVHRPSSSVFILPSLSLILTQLLYSLDLVLPQNTFLDATDPATMRLRRQTSPSSSPDESDSADLESCFDTECDGSDPDTNPTDDDTDIELDDDANVSWLVEQNNIHPPEHYLEQENDFNEAEFDTEDYGDNTVLLFDVMKDRWHR